jgi:hypothetical protein
MQTALKKAAQASIFLVMRSLDTLILTRMGSDAAICMYYTGLDQFTG